MKADPAICTRTDRDTPRLEIVAEDAERIEARFGLEALERRHPAAFIDRHGWLKLPFQVAEATAKQKAESEAQSVLLYLQEREEELLALGYQPGHRTAHEILREYQPSFALAREWAGGRAEAELLTKEADRLRRLVHEGNWMLKRAGAETEAPTSRTRPRRQIVTACGYTR